MRLLMRSMIVFLLLGGNPIVYGQLHLESLPPNADAHVNSALPTSTYGTTTTLSTYVISSVNHFRTFVSFDIASLAIPTNAVITAAELRLKPNASGEGTVTNADFVLQRVTATWSEAVTYNTQPATSTVNQVTASAFTGGKRVFDVKTLVQEIVTGTSVNYGWRIHRNPETTATSTCLYNSRQASTTTDRPELYISWYVPMSITAATIVHATSSTSSNGSITPTITNGSGGFAYEWTNSAGTVIATTANLTNRPYGWYGLKVTGTSGDVLYMAFIIGAQCEPVSITFNPGPNFIDDAMIYNHTSGVNTNYGTYPVLLASTWTNSTWYEARNLMRFRLWLDPALEAVTSDLYLFGSSHSTLQRTNDAELVQVTQPWDEMTVTYTNQPTFASLISTNVPPTTGTTDNKVLDIKDFWNAWKTNNPANYGMLLKLDTYVQQYTRQQYHSSDATTSANWPYVQFVVDQPACDRTSYVAFKRELDAGYAVTYQGKLKFQFTEEYKQTPGKSIPLTLYDENMAIKAAVSYDGTVVGANPLLQALTYRFDDNRYQLTLTGYGLVVNQTYILEVTKSTGEKEYIKFLYLN